ncbi:hypothetical protein [Fluviispira multicolorata]|uniref:Lipoprotein n=1 Tax=Fluviispira multicolorata TaxID=2654512 RepID=A0A833N520_9BACT|nr:hypothetical protein [Fluviispira multicolorata]KAB8032048.1 hypothetical protein GCL57_05210 [Fluviispira multicolorata]
MRHKLKILFTSPLLLVGCTEHAPPNTTQISAASCPIAPMKVLSVSYNEDRGRYTIFHTTTNGGEKIKNPLNTENIQMAQIPMPQGESSDFARLQFKKDNGSCEPVLEMTQGFKIELAAPPKVVNNTTGNGEGGGHSGSSGGSSWAPFLMGALVGNAISSAMQPRYAPAYYLPPPAGATGSNGLVTGGVSGKSPDELNKKYESTYNKPAKKGFFSKKSNLSNSNDSQSNKKSFFSKKDNSSFSSGSDRPKKSGFFSGGGRSGGSRRR